MTLLVPVRRSICTIFAWRICATSFPWVFSLLELSDRVYTACGLWRMHLATLNATQVFGVIIEIVLLNVLCGPLRIMWLLSLYVVLLHTILYILSLRPLHPNLSLNGVLVGERSPAWVKCINTTHSSVELETFALTCFLFTCCTSHLASAKWLVVQRRRLRLSWQAFKRLLLGSSNLSNNILALMITCIAVFILLLEVVGVPRSLRLWVIGRRLFAMMRCLSQLAILNRLGRILVWTHLHSVIC
jgi:hypothetical protein